MEDEDKNTENDMKNIDGEEGDEGIEANDKTIKTENTNHKMKIKCVKCKLTDSLTEEDIKLLSHVVKRYNQKPSPTDYTAVLSIIKGNCTDNNKHLFIFDESFDKDIADTIKEYRDAIVANTTRKGNLEKIISQINETTNQIKALQSTLGELDKKKEYTVSEISTGGILIDNIKLKFEKLTGTTDIDMWS